MPELLNSKRDKRVIFPSGKQHSFLLKAVNRLKLSWVDLAEKINVHRRTLNDWKREKYSVPLSIVRLLSNKANIPIPSNIELKERYWYTALGSSAGAMAVLKKYGRIGGNPEYRKKKWYEWWEREGRYRKHSIIGVSKPIKKPHFSKELAEFAGIMMGDGGITKNQIRVTLNNKTDKVYSGFIKNLIKRLFKVKPSIYVDENDSTINIVVSRVRLVKFCKSIGLKIGNKLKQNLDIPEWIRLDKNFKISCIRGLMDTDGCLFNECHRINKKKYCYPRLSFTSASKQLRLSVFKILKELGFSPKIRNNRCVQLENQKDIIKYFELIGTNNQHHKVRFKSFSGGVGSGCPKWS